MSAPMPPPDPPEEEFSLSDLVRRKRALEEGEGAAPPPPGIPPAVPPFPPAPPSGPPGGPRGGEGGGAGGGGERKAAFSLAERAVERFDIRHQWGVVRRRWGIVTLATALVTATSSYATYRQPDLYEATATIGMRRAAAAVPVRGGSAGADFIDMETVANRVRLPSLALEAARLVRDSARRAREHPLYGQVTPEQADLAYRIVVEGEDPPEGEGSPLTGEILDRLRPLFEGPAMGMGGIDPGGPGIPVGEMLRIPAAEFEQALRMDAGSMAAVQPVVSTDGELLQLVSRGQGLHLCALRCNALAVAFLLRDVRSHQEGARRMEETLSQLIVEREVELTHKQVEVQEYKEAWAQEHRDQGGHLSADEERLLDRLKEAEGLLREARDDLRIKAARQTQVAATLDAARGAAMDAERAQRAREGLAQREIDLRLLLERLGDRHPQVEQLRREIGNLEAVLREAEGDGAAMGPEARRDLEREAGELQGDVSALQERVPSLERRVEELETQLTSFRSRYELDLARLTNEEEILAASLQGLRESQQEARVSRESAVGVLQLEERAAMPAVRVGPDRTRAFLFAALAGLGLGVLAAFFLEHLDDTVKTSGDVQRQLGVVPLAVIPEWSEAEPRVIPVEDPQSIIADVYAVFRNNIRYSSSRRPEKMLLLTSALKSEGKTQVAVNLGLSYALEGNRVLLIDADLRRKKGGLTAIVEGLGKLRGTVGLGDYLEGRAPLEAICHEMEPPNLFFLPRGSDVKNPARLLRSPRVAQLLAAVEQQYEVVIIDTAAVIPVVDATLVSPLVRGTVLVVAADATPLPAVRQAISRLTHVNSPLVGAVLNRARHVSADSYFYGGRYTYGYGDREEEGLLDWMRRKVKRK